MVTGTIAKQSRVQIPLKVGGMLFALGLIAFAASVTRGFISRREDAKDPAINPASFDAKEKEYADKLSAAIKTEEDERDRLRSDNEALSSRIKIIDSKILKSTGKSALADQPETTALNDVLASYQAAVVSVLPPGSMPGTGFLYQVDAANTVVVTCIPPKSQSGVIQLQYHKVRQNRSKGDQVSINATISYSDPKSGLCILRAPFGDTISQLETVKPARIGAAVAGDRVYTVLSQLRADGTIESSVMDGDLSTADRKIGSVNLLQVAIGAEESLRGSPLFNSAGQLIGVMVIPAKEIERTSFAFNAADLNGPLQIVKSAGGWTNTPAVVTNASSPAAPAIPAQPAPPPQVRPATPREVAAAHPVPYEASESILLQLPLFGDAVENSLFAGPDNTVIVSNEVINRLAAYRPRTNTPVWQYTPAFGSYLSRIFGSNNIFVAVSGFDHKAIELDLKTGKVSKNGLKAGATRSTSLFRIGDGYLSAAPGNYYLDPASGYELPNGGDRILGMVGDRVFAMGPRTLCYFSTQDSLSLLRRVTENQAKLQSLSTEPKDAEARRRALLETNDIYQKATASRNRVTVPEQSWFTTARAFQLGGTEKFVVGCDLLEINVNGARKLATLKEPIHSAFKEAWFQGYIQAAQLPPGVIGVSSDGKHALTSTHVINPLTFEILFELPLPVRKGGFLSDNETIYAYDDVHGRVYFLSLSALRKP